MERYLIYVCSPYSGDIQYNRLAALMFSRYVVEQGYIPITPHIYFTQFMIDTIPEERELAFKMSFDLMELCDKMWVFVDSDNTITPGMQSEIEHANSIGLKIEYITVSDELKVFILGGMR